MAATVRERRSERRSRAGGGARGHGEARRAASGDSRTVAAAEEVGNAEAFAYRRGQPFSAGSPGIHAGLHGDGGSERRSFDRGTTGQPGTERQRVAGADGKPGTTRVWRAAGTSECRQRLFLSVQPRSDGRTWHRCVCSGQQHGLCFASWWNAETTYASCAPPSHAKQVSFDDRTSVIPATESTGRAGHRDFERAARNAEIQDARAGKSSRGVCPGHYRVELDTHVAAQPARETFRVEQIHTKRSTTSPDKQMNHETHQNSPQATQLPHRLGHLRQSRGGDRGDGRGLYADSCRSLQAGKSHVAQGNGHGHCVRRSRCPGFGKRYFRALAVRAG